MWPFSKKTYHTELPKPTRPAPAMPKCKLTKYEVPTISEPVLSIIKTLENGEWDYA